MMNSFDPVEKLWKGPAVPYPFPKDVYLGEKLLDILQESPDSILTISHEENCSMTRGEARRLSINFARNLMKLGIQPDDVVGVICRHSNNLTVIVYGCIIVGAPINPLEVSFLRQDIVQLFDQTKPKLVFCDSDIYWTVKKAMDDLQSDAQIFTVLDKVPGAPHVTKLLESSESNEKFVAPKFDKPADKKLVSILCTSGTTGTPKGVGQSHASLLLFTNFPQPLLPFTSLSFSPIYWISGFFSSALSAFRTLETKVQTMKPYSNELFGELQEKYKIAMTFLPPSQIYSFLQSSVADSPAFENLKMIYTGGSLVSHQLIEQLRQKLPKVPLGIGYGMTETSIAMMVSGRIYENKTTVGSVNPNLIVKIVDEEETKLGPKEAGEIRVQPHLPFLGYYNNPKATTNVLDSEGFIKTGDLGYFNDDQSLMVVDRIKDTFKYKGFHVNPSEVEDCILQLEGVETVSVIGVPNEETQNLATAAVVKKVGFEGLTTREIISHVAKNLPPVKQLHGGVVFMEALPMTVSGKVLKKVIRKGLSK